MSDLASLSSAGASIHQEVDFHASPERLYDALLDERQFSAFSGAPAQIEREAGGAFRLFGGRVTGRNVELLPNQRIVQAWRIGAWPAGIYAIVKFELVAQGTGTHLVFDEWGFPPEDGQAHSDNWPKVYWGPLQGYLDS
jgi:activator of HSP90 ATPase